jgi:hypothetical protein
MAYLGSYCFARCIAIIAIITIMVIIAIKVRSNGHGLKTTSVTCIASQPLNSGVHYNSAACGAALISNAGCEATRSGCAT